MMKKLLGLLILVISIGYQESHAVRIGEESRSEVVNTEDPTTRRVGVLKSKYSNFDGECTASLIGPDLVITAAHCVYAQEHGGWAQSVVFMPDMYRNKTDQQNDYLIDNIFYLPKYLQFAVPHGFAKEGVPSDIALLHLKKTAGLEPAGEIYGWFGVGVGIPAGKASMISYPGRKPLHTKWIEKDCALYGYKEGVYNFECDAAQGASGSAILVRDGDELVINGIFSSDSSVFGMNFAAKIEANIFDGITSIINGQPQSIFSEHPINK